eukprot:CAMPEP_0205893492 /NCGR_PEP_ID=MMETSP1083-20121108/23292_1 /ASSEMBLY_ACC=CAM_ASM_000430 /TAXON_ID=97485 /ORGANISM="Prymnesium parvum, Strain Texoma1" /LENGTH=107 /DNA_ID=CAMNT_0053258187 /DNA_START=428 /DNA_END=752 /DNA_ORIENTATION=+
MHKEGGPLFCSDVMDDETKQATGLGSACALVELALSLGDHAGSDGFKVTSRLNPFMSVSYQKRYAHASVADVGTRTPSSVGSAAGECKPSQDKRELDNVVRIVVLTT